MDDIAKLEEELEALRTKNQAHRDEVARRARAAELRAAVLAESNAARDAEPLAEVDEAHGPRGTGYDVVVCRLGAVALKKPGPAVWKRFQTSKQDPRDAAEALVRSCLAYPSTESFNAIVDDQPAALEALALTVARLAGADIERIQGKS